MNCILTGFWSILIVYLAMGSWSAVVAGQGAKARWVEVGPQTDAKVSGASLSADPDRPGVYYLPSSLGMFTSMDGARVWQMPGGTPSTAPLWLDSSTVPPTLFQTPTLRSVDEGVSWLLAAGDGLPPRFLVFALDTTTQPTTIYVAAQPLAPDQPNFPGMAFKSVDLGETFQMIDSGLTGGTKVIADITTSPSTVYIVLGAFLRRTSDGGMTWQTLPIPSAGSGPLDVECDIGSSPCTLFASTFAGGILRSEDRGETWVQHDSPPVPLDELELDSSRSPNSLYGLAGGELYRNVGGLGWEKVDAPGAEGVEFIYLSLDTASTPTRVFCLPQAEQALRVFELQSLQSRYLAQIGSGSEADIGFEATVILGNASQDTKAQVEFFDSNGSPLPLFLEEQGMTASLELDLPRGTSRTLHTSGDGPIRVGYAKATAGTGVGGTAIFSRRHLPQGTLLYEAGVPLTEPLTDFSIPVDTLGDRNVGLALVNTATTGEPAIVVLALYDQDFQKLGERTIEIPLGGHLPRFIDELLDNLPKDVVGELEGLLTVSSTQPLAVVALRQNGDAGFFFPQTVPTLTAFPVLLGRPDQ